MNIKPIKTEEDYQRALKRIDKLWDAKPDTPEGDEEEIFFTLVESYEEEHYPIPPPHPIEAIKFIMEQKGLGKSDMAKYFGIRSRVSEIFSGKRRLTGKNDEKTTSGTGRPGGSASGGLIS